MTSYWIHTTTGPMTLLDSNDMITIISALLELKRVSGAPSMQQHCQELADKFNIVLEQGRS